MADRDGGPLTLTQEMLWRLHRELAEPEALNMFYALEVRGPLDRRALGRALRALARRHEPLRATYDQRDGEPRARIHGPSGPVLAPAWTDLRHLEGGEARARLARHAAREAGRRFDLARGPVARAHLFTLAEEESVLLLNFHHIGADGWSLDLFGRQLGKLYGRLAAGEAEPAGDPEPSLGCAGHARWQRRWLAGDEARDQEEAWRRALGGLTPASFRLPRDAPPGSLPHRDRDGNGSRANPMGRRLLPLSRALSEELGDLARRRGASIFMILLTAVQVLVARWSGCTDVVVGTLVANRETADSAEVLGAHYNPILLRTRLAEEGDTGDPPTLGEVLMRTVETTLPALERQALPFERVLGLLEEAGLDPRTVPAVNLQLDRYPLYSLRLPGLEVRPLHLDPAGAPRLEALAEEPAPPRTLLAATQARLTFFVREGDGRLTVSLFHDRAVVSDRRAASLLRAYGEVLLALVEELNTPYTELDLDLTGSAAAGEEEPAAGETRPPNGDPGPGGPTLLPMAEILPVDALSPVMGLGASRQSKGANRACS